jgi:hypothetical protein
LFWEAGVSEVERDRDFQDQCSHQAVDASKTSAVVFDQILETDVLEEVLLPSLLAAVDTDGDVTLLADG